MRTRTWAIVITINVVISAVVMLTVLLIWDRMAVSPPPSPTTMPVSTHVPTKQAISSPLPTSTEPLMATLGSEFTSEPVQYTVQSGDTLGAIAQSYGVSLEALMAANNIVNPNLLQVGQTLVIPVAPQAPPAVEPASDVTAEPAGATPPLDNVLAAQAPTLTPSGPTLIEIGQVLGAGDLNREVLVIRNGGGSVDLEGWTLSDADGNVFTFPKITLFADVQMRVHSAPGRSTPSDLYWGRDAPAWNVGEIITLRDQDDNVVDTYIVP